MPRITKVDKAKAKVARAEADLVEFKKANPDFAAKVAEAKEKVKTAAAYEKKCRDEYDRACREFDKTHRLWLASKNEPHPALIKAVEKIVDWKWADREQLIDKNRYNSHPFKSALVALNRRLQKADPKLQKLYAELNLACKLEREASNEFHYVEHPLKNLEHYVMWAKQELAVAIRESEERKIKKVKVAETRDVKKWRKARELLRQIENGELEVKW